MSDLRLNKRGIGDLITVGGGNELFFERPVQPQAVLREENVVKIISGIFLAAIAFVAVYASPVSVDGRIG